MGATDHRPAHGTRGRVADEETEEATRLLDEALACELRDTGDARRPTSAGARV